jgi:hypothetical protein
MRLLSYLIALDSARDLAVPLIRLFQFVRLSFFSEASSMLYSIVHALFYRRETFA